MLDVRHPFTRAQARVAGITDRQLASPAFRQLLVGVYVSARVPDHPLIRAKAALLVHPPTAVASHQSSARVRGLAVPADPVEHVTVAAARERRQRLGIRCHVAVLAASEVELVAGVRITAPGRMFTELAAGLSLVDLVVVGDQLVRRGLIGLAELRHAAAGDKRAARAASLVRAEVDSPMETRLRMLLVLAGLPEPVVNGSVYDDHGVVVWRLDLSYPSVKVAVEYDGRHHIERQEQWERDLRRREELERAGWRILVVTARDLYRDPAGTVERVWHALAERSWPRLRPPVDGWRAHFPAV